LRLIGKSRKEWMPSVRKRKERKKKEERLK
jgi:hypothetical protein